MQLTCWLASYAWLERRQDDPGCWGSWSQAENFSDQPDTAEDSSLPEEAKYVHNY